MRRTLLAALLAACGAAPAAAEAGRTGGVTLSRPLGARATAVADAFSAVEGGLDSLSYNPAGLSGVERRELRTDFMHGIVDDNFSFLGYGQRLGRLVLAAGGAYYNGGSITLNLSDGTRSRVKVQQDWVGLFAASLELGAGLSVGGAAKYYRFELGDAATASGTAFDAGARWQTPVRGLALGAAVQNAGPDVKYEEEGDPLPLTARAGAAFEVGHSPSKDPSSIGFDRFIFSADVIKTREERPAAATGAEMRLTFTPNGYGALRVGYVFNRDIDSFSLGIGMREGRFVFDYALGIKKVISNAHHFSLGFLF